VWQCGRFLEESILVVGGEGSWVKFEGRYYVLFLKSAVVVSDRGESVRKKREMVNSQMVIQPNERWEKEGRGRRRRRRRRTLSVALSWSPSPSSSSSALL
jgi:hypothetical protein